MAPRVVSRGQRGDGQDWAWLMLHVASQLPLPHHTLGARLSLNSPFYCWVNQGLLHRGPGTCPRPHGTAARGRHRAQTHGSLDLCSQALKHRSPETTPTPEGGRQCPGELTPRSLRASQPPPHTMHTSRQPGSGLVQVSSDSTSNSPPGLTSSLMSFPAQRNIPCQQREAIVSDSSSTAHGWSLSVHTCRICHCNNPKPPSPDTGQTDGSLPAPHQGLPSGQVVPKGHRPLKGTSFTKQVTHCHLPKSGPRQMSKDPSSCPGNDLGEDTPRG